MKYIFTARHFKAPDDLKEFAKESVEKLTKFYNGIIKSEVVLSYEKANANIKNAEIIITTNSHHKFMAKEQSNDFKLSIEAAAEKVSTQIKKFKDKLRDNHAGKQTKYDSLTG